MKGQQRIIRFGFVLAITFWIVDASLDSLLSVERISFLESFLHPAGNVLWKRGFVVLLFMLFCAYTERLLKVINSMTRKLECSNKQLKSYHDQLECTVDELQDEIIKRKRAIDELAVLAETDPLTTLLNRRKFNELLDYEVHRSQRYQTDLSIITCDIDHFKRINDHYGHNEGDSVLKAFSVKMTENIRDIDILARWGGEEFMILMPNTNLETASMVAEKLRKITELTSIGKVGSLTASFGVTHYKQGDSTESFIKRVDDALYKAKDNGRNAVETTECRKSTAGSVHSHRHKKH